jgi:hypothetical protein
MGQNSFPLRLMPSLRAEARKTAEQEGVSLNQLINLAVAEKISALRTEEFFRTRAANADIAKARAILKRAGTEPPRKGDEIPADIKKRRSKRRAPKVKNNSL